MSPQGAPRPEAGSAGPRPGSAFGDRQLDEVIAQRPDAVVLALPAGRRAEGAIRALEAGLSVFCEAPVGADTAETEAVIAAARRTDRLISVDLGLRHSEAARALRRDLASGDLGSPTFVDLVCHQREATGPETKMPTWRGADALPRSGFLLSISRWTCLAGPSRIARPHSCSGMDGC